MPHCTADTAEVPSPAEQPRVPYVQVTGGCYALVVPADEIAPLERRGNKSDAG